MFHLRDGLYFDREENGLVAIYKKNVGGGFDFASRIPAAEWASVVAAVRPEGETSETYAQALAFHMGAPDRAKKLEAAINRYLAHDLSCNGGAEQLFNEALAPDRHALESYATRR